MTAIFCFGTAFSSFCFVHVDFYGNFHSHSNVDAENSTKLIQAITWRSASSRSSSCKSLVASNSKSASTWTEFSNDLFDDYGGMTSGSHSLTLGRLYAWEKKLYEEVKVN